MHTTPVTSTTTSRRLLAALFAAVACTAFVYAGGGPENVAVVVNADSWASQTIANEFVQLRQVPPSNVIYLVDIPNFEYADVETFRQKVLAPMLAALRERGLTDQIDCIAYSCDLPYAIEVRPDLAGKPAPQVLTPTASSNGLTFLYQDVLKKDPAYLRLDANRYMRRTLPLQQGRPLTEAEQKRVVDAEALYNQKKWVEAADGFAAVARDHADDANLLYNLACCQARAGRNDDALATLQKAVTAGWRNHRHTAGDEDLASLRERADFRALLDKMKNLAVDVQPTRGFRGSVGWDDRGEIARTGGRQYLLSTVLGITSGRGNSVREVLAALRRSAAVDGTRPAGTIYLLRNDDVRSTTREWAFESAVRALKALGVAAAIEQGVLPTGKADVAGAVIGISDFDWPGSRSTILPGAICEHLTSTGGVLDESGGQTPCTEFIRRGAAGSSGTVTEPYAIQDKFPTAFVQVHYARGSTLAEAFYQAVRGPYQLLILGDPLCQPWAKRPEVTLSGLTANATIRGKVEVRAVVAKEPPSAIDRFELFADGRRVTTAKPGQPLVLDASKLADGYHEIAAVAVRSDALETHGRVAVTANVANGDRSVTVTPARPASTRWGERVTLQLKSPGAREISVFQNERKLGRVSGADGKLEVDTRQLGLGPIRLFAVAAFDAASVKQVRSKPIEFTIEPPAEIAAPASPPEGKLEKGLRLSFDKHAPVVIDDTRADDWLAKSGVAAGQSFELQGCFEAPENDLYQLQVHSNMALSIELGESKLDVPQRGGWSYLPVALRPGMQLLRIHGKAVENPRLEVRLGAAGTYRLSGARFRHTAE